MDVPLVIRQRLEELGVEQRALATAAQVTESYISQLLTRKKAPPAPNRTDIYVKMETFLKLPRGELSKLASLQREEELDRKSTRLNSSHGYISYAVFCLKKKKKNNTPSSYRAVQSPR